MTDQAHRATSGYSLEKIYFAEQAATLVGKKGKLPRKSGDFQFGWDWRLLGEGRFEVVLHLGFDASEERREKIRLTVCGLFRALAEDPTPSLDSFVRIHAPAILMPYAREGVSALTGRGLYGAFILPVVNVLRLMEDSDPSQAIGENQLRKGETLFTSRSPVPEPGRESDNPEIASTKRK